VNSGKYGFTTRCVAEPGDTTRRRGFAKTLAKKNTNKTWLGTKGTDMGSHRRKAGRSVLRYMVVRQTAETKKKKALTGE